MSETQETIVTEQESDGAITLDEISHQIEALGAIDESITVEDNLDSSASAETLEEALKGMGGRLDTLEAENRRLTELLGKMVTVYGARINSASTPQGTEAFPTKVEQTFDPAETESVISLSDITLGS